MNVQLPRIIFELSQANQIAEREKQLRRFARQYEWEPSDLLCEDSYTADTATAHLVVEYGLQYSAVLTFLREKRPFPTLSPRDRESILRISYNNAVDWHLVIDGSNTSFLNNRLREHVVRHVSLTEDPDGASSRCFPKYTSARVKHQFQRIDDLLIQSIEFWRRRLSAAIGRYDINANLSALFNTLIFLRVLEDQAAAAGSRLNQNLVALAETNSSTILDIFRAFLKSLGKTEFPKFIRDKFPLLSVFDDVPRSEVQSLIQDFYMGAGCPYPYDFSMISRHALSLIYEKYVSIVRESSDPQLAFYPLADSVSNRSLGTIYTPQFIARFFARYLNRNVSPVHLAESRILDPACGSGVFLRCVAEVFTDASALHDVAAQQKLFRNLYGYDIDASAVDASQLSLALLHVSHFGEFPKQINVMQTESLGRLAEGKDRFSAIIANPPFLPWDKMSDALRGVVVRVLGQRAKGKADAYQAFLQCAMQSLDNEGHLLFVLPQSFLTARSAKGLRRELGTTFSIDVIADLSNISVFEGIGAYVILLVARKKVPDRHYTTIVRCRDFPGQALNEVLHGRKGENDFFQVFKTSQESLSDNGWQLLPPREMELVELLQRHVRLHVLAEVKSGMVSGGKNLFTVQAHEVPKTEIHLWPLLLADREMRYFGVPETSGHRMFFPVVDGAVVSEHDIKKYTWTWAVLKERSAQLKERAAVKNDEIPWWRPHRLPDFIRKQKIVAPHVALAPRFGFDRLGEFVVTQGPVILARIPASTDNLDWYLLALLNSAMVRWQIQRFAPRYARGYALLEPKTLREILIPDPAQLPVRLYSDIVEQSQELWECTEVTEDDLKAIDLLSLEAFRVPADLSAMMQKVY